MFSIYRLGVCVSEWPVDTIQQCSSYHDCHHDEICRNMGICAIAWMKHYCITHEACRKGDKCVASGRPEHGVCKPESDPTGDYCVSTSNCKWYLMETCSEQGECVKRYD